MRKLNKITELIDKYKEQLERLRKVSDRLEADSEIHQSRFHYSKGLINAKEEFIEELEKMKDYYSYE